MSAVPAQQQREAGPWVLEREIGSGSFAKVWQATHKHTQQVAAVKEINLDRLSKKLQESLASEVAVLRHTQHHNIVCLVDLIKDGNRLYLVLEYCAGGDLGHYLRRYRQVSEGTARYFLQQVAEGLKELRRHNVIHRDLKPQNLLLSDRSSSPLLKIADFGFARSLAPQGLAETLCGSPLYMAPEILQFQKYDAKADLWSIGTILFELLVGKPPYNGANHIQLLRNIEAAEARLPDHIAARLSPDCRGLLERLLQRNPVERITFEEFFSHPFLTSASAAAAGGGGSGGAAAVGGYHAGTIPPPQPVPVAGAAGAGAALPAAMRQAAAAAAAAAATTADRAHRAAGTSSVAKPQLHLMSSVQQKQQHHAPAAAGAAHAGPSSHLQPAAEQWQQQQQQQHHVPMPPAPPHLQQQQQQQYIQQQHQQQLQQQQQYLAGLVSQPVSQHPLARHPPPQPVDITVGAAGGGEALIMSDSMEGDFVVVYTPNDSSASTPHTRSTSNSSSKASSGLADPKAAAVLQGTPPLNPAGGGGARRMAWQQAEHAAAVTSTSTPPQQQQQRPLPHYLQQQQHMPTPVTAQQVVSSGGGYGGGQVCVVPHQHQGLIQVSSPLQQGHQAAAVGHQPAGVGDGGGTVGVSASVMAMMQHSSLQLPATPLQRVQLLVQVVRGCVSLLSSHDSSGGGGGGGAGGVGLRDAAGRSCSSLQEGEQLALLLLALQVVQLLCCPAASSAQQDSSKQQADQQQQHKEEQEGAVGGKDSEADDVCDLAAVLAAASQSDVEQLMAAVVDLLKLAETHAAALTEHQLQQQQQQGAPHTGPDSSCAYQQQQGQHDTNNPSTMHWAGAEGAAASHMISSLLSVPLPDPAGVLYHAALDSCRAAAVEEVMGNWQAALDGYSLAADLLLFLGQQWPELPAPADPGLQPQEQAALHRLYAAVNARLMAVVADAPPLALQC